MSEQQNDLTPQVDEFLLEIQSELVQSLKTRFDEFAAEQEANFPSVADFGAVTAPLWQELIKDFKNCALLDWAAYLEELSPAFNNPPFTVLWQTAKPEAKAKFWDFVQASLFETAKGFKSGQNSAFTSVADVITKLQTHSSTEKNTSAPVELKPSSSVIDEDLYLKCTIRSQDFILPVSKVVEIQQIRKLTPLPEEQINISGLISSRGEMFPIFSLYELEEISKENTDFKYFVVCEEKGHKYGFAVDSTDQVIRIDRSSFQPASAVSGFHATTYIQHSIILEEKILLVIEPEKIAS